MEVKAGYKQTEVGLIPEDWALPLLADISVISRLAGAEYTSVWEETPNGEIIALRGFNIEKGRIVERDFVRISNELSLKLKRSRLCKGDVVYPCVGSIGNAAVISEDGKYHIQQNIARITPNSTAINSTYLAHYLMSSLGDREVERFSASSSQPSVLVGSLRQYQIPLPPTREEQEAIAGALSDADALIESLEQLLAKKRQIKQGAMQELLTGKKRLPGFTGDWETTQLGELGSTFGGLTGKSKRDFSCGAARYITFMNIMTNVVINCGVFENVDVKAGERQSRVEVGDIFFNGSSETPEEVGMCAVLLEPVENVYLNSFCFGFRLLDRAAADGLFLAYYFRSRQGRELLKSLAQGATRYNLSKTALLRLSFQLPSFPEQIVIVAVLAEMDADIAALEVKLAKARQIKQGMMQDLLTGRIRLV